MSKKISWDKQFPKLTNAKKRTLLIPIALFIWSSHAAAEGNCPSGYYPIGGQGVQGCAPIPAGSSSGGTYANNDYYVARESLWGAIAEDKRRALNARPTGYSVHQSSKEDAQSSAIELCKKDGGQNCEVIYSYKDGCVALADPIKGGQETEIRYDYSLRVAKHTALNFCMFKNRQECSIVYSGCSFD